MKTLLIAIALLGAQLPQRRTEDVVVLSAPKMGIGADLGGKFVQLKYAPPVLRLPAAVPPPLPGGIPWYVDVVNFGPRDVTLEGPGNFSLLLHPKDAARIVPAGSGYTVIHKY